MPIFMNARATQHPSSGMHRYTTELASRMKGVIEIMGPGWASRGWAGHLWEQIVLPKIIPAGAILWSPANSGPLRCRNQVITIHDIAVLDHPEWYSHTFAAWYRLALPRLAENSQQIITLSEFSKSRIIERLRVPREKVTVIPPGVGLPFLQPRKSGPEVEGSKIRRPYLLALGSFQPRKNLQRLVDAWPKIRGQNPELSLVLLGASDYVFAKTTIETQHDAVWHLKSPDDGQLAALYQGAELLIYPSLYEGFGMPILEAMACGTPVIASNHPALQEAGGADALYFDPLSTNKLAEIILKALHDESLRRKLSEQGLKRAEKFSWERSAKAIQEVLETVTSR